MMSMAMDRRARFRDYMRRLDPTASPDRAVAEGFYVAPPGAIASRIGARLDIEPASSHLLMGGIGCGKTTELLAIREYLSSIPDVGVAVVDVLARQRESKLEPGILLVLAGVELVDWIRHEHATKVDAALLQRASRAIEGVAHGRYEDDRHDRDPVQSEPFQRWVPGVLEEPTKRPSLEEVAREIHALLHAAGATFTLLLDGLDRLPDPQVFARMIRVDIPLLRQASVGVAVIGPQSLRFEIDRSPQELFSDVHLHGAVNVGDEDGQTFLRSVLRARVGADMLPDESCDRLIGASGGVLRDLISLARAAGEIAYSLGHEAVEVDDVDASATRFGRALVLGMTEDMLERLSQLAKQHYLGPSPARAWPGVIATDADVSLLLHRVLIEVPTTPVQYLVHPTIVPLLPYLHRKTA